MTIQDKRATVRDTVICCVEAPSLKKVSIRQCVEFKRLAALCEKPVDEKVKQLKEAMISTSVRASIEHDDLHIIIVAGWIYAALPNQIT